MQTYYDVSIHTKTKCMYNLQDINGEVTNHDKEKPGLLESSGTRTGHQTIASNLEPLNFHWRSFSRNKTFYLGEGPRGVVECFIYTFSFVAANRNQMRWTFTSLSLSHTHTHTQIEREREKTNLRLFKTRLAIRPFKTNHPIPTPTTGCWMLLT